MKSYPRVESLKNKKMPSLFRNEKGQALTEYMAILILISIVSIAAVQSVGTTVKKKVREARQKINSGIVFKDAN